jgi:flagellar basal body-associated protein FliL
VSFAAITLCVASQRVFIIIIIIIMIIIIIIIAAAAVVYFVIDSVGKLLDTPSYLSSKSTRE